MPPTTCCPPPTLPARKEKALRWRRSRHEPSTGDAGVGRRFPESLKNRYMYSIVCGRTKANVYRSTFNKGLINFSLPAQVGLSYRQGRRRCPSWAGRGRRGAPCALRRRPGRPRQGGRGRRRQRRRRRRTARRRRRDWLSRGRVERRRTGI